MHQNLLEGLGPTPKPLIGGEGIEFAFLTSSQVMLVRGPGDAGQGSTL